MQPTNRLHCLWCSFLLTLCMALLVLPAAYAEDKPSIRRFQSCLAGGVGLMVLDTSTGQVWDTYTFGEFKPKEAKDNDLPVGRFQWPVSIGKIDGAYVIDSVTGQVWALKDEEFYAPKLKVPAARSY